MTHERFERAIAQFQQAHAEDPNTDASAASGRPWSVYYHERLAHWVARIGPPPSEPMRLAAACQHIRRHERPRSLFPAGQVGYKQWRSSLAQFHAEQAEQVLRSCGYGDDVIEAVRGLLIKKGLRKDPEVQRFEDAICLTFIETQLTDFATQHERPKVIDIIRKTWAKMSPAGHDEAKQLAATLSPPVQELLAEALTAA